MCIFVFLMCRFQESVSEDPWLNGAYAASYVAGIQGAGDGSNYTKIAACCEWLSEPTITMCMANNHYVHGRAFTFVRVSESATTY